MTAAKPDRTQRLRVLRRWALGLLLGALALFLVAAAHDFAGPWAWVG
ncbi:DUF445 domain-containing protein, partial [Acidithiobacillus sp. MC6.1]|nr:DUF445 domain-containing protein [Acidithiobacillus sp. MC6.1]